MEDIGNLLHGFAVVLQPYNVVAQRPAEGFVRPEA